MSSNHRLVECWRKCNLDAPPYLFPDDEAQTISRFAKTYHSFADYTASPEFGSSTDSSLHTGLIPAPYAGNLAEASIFVLMLNPGLSPGDYFAEEDSKFRQAQIRSLKQENAKDKYPFIYLDPQFAWHPGFGYSHNKFHAIISELSKKREIAYQEAMSQLSRKLVFLELLPYHSRTFGAGALLDSLPSVQAMRSFVSDVLLPRVKDENAIAIVTRSVKNWNLPRRKNIIVYEGGETRSAHLTPSSRGGHEIMQHLGLS